MIKKILVLFSLLIFFGVMPKEAKAFGISPDGINAKNLRPGDHYEEIITVTRPPYETDEDMKVILDTNLGEMENWFKFEPGKEFIFPKGKNRITFKAIVDVPKDAKITKYEGEISVKGLPTVSAPSGGVSMVKSALLETIVETTDQGFTKLSVLSMNMPDVGEGEAVRLVMKVQNLGNTPAAPTKVSVEILDLGNRSMETVEDTSLNPIPPYTTQEITAEFNSQAAKGQYWGKIDVYLGEELIKSEKLMFTVNAVQAEVKETSGNVPLLNVSLDKPLGIGLVTAGAAGIALLSYLLHKGKKRRKMTELEKIFSNLHRHFKYLSYFFGLLSIIMIASGILLITYQGQPNLQAETPQKQVESLPPVVEEEEVKGVSTAGTVQEKEDTAPFVVQKNTTVTVYPVYENPDSNSAVIYEASEGEKLDAVEFDDGWYKVQLPAGLTGWISRGSIKN